MSLLGVVTVVLLSTTLGLLLLRGAYGVQHSVLIVLLSQGFNLVATAYRFRSEISHPLYTDVSPDSYRFIEGGRARWVDSAPLLDGITIGDGTQNTFVLSHWFFAAFGDDRALVFLAGSTCGLVGLWLVALALRTAAPSVPSLFGYLVCLTPSIGYWSSSFGKDAFTFLAVGACLWAVADAASVRRLRALHVLVYVPAVMLMILLRIDIGIVLVASWMISWLGVTGQGGMRFRRGLLVVVLGGAPAFLLGASLVGWDDPWGIVSSFSGTTDRTAIGGSALSGDRPAGVAGFVIGAITAIFRPFPWEFGLGGLISSLDIVVFGALVVVVVRAMRRGRTWELPDARVTVFGALFSIAVFSQLMQMANLGLLVRLRSLIVPVLIVIVALLLQERERPLERTALRERRVAPPFLRVP